MALGQSSLSSNPGPRMVFSAPTFLFLFLPTILAAVLVAPRGLRNTLLLGASLFFYAWGETDFVLLMIGSIVFNYLAGLCLGRAGAEGRRWTAPILLGLAIAGNLGVLAWFKYAGFLARNLSALFVSLGLGAVPFDAAGAESIHLPIGISFFTFQAISYLIEPQKHEPVIATIDSPACASDYSSTRA